MSREALIQDIGEWLVDQALSDPDIIEMFTQVCHRLYAIGVPVARARLTWPTLHPLFTAETILWNRGKETEFEQFRHQEEVSPAWLASPMNYMLQNGISELRRNLDGPNRMIDFPVLEELVSDGMTDYLIIATGFDSHSTTMTVDANGMLVSWASDREGGFSNDDLLALKRIQRRFASACKTVIQARIGRNITETYLGRQAGRAVLDGQISLGTGQETRAVVWYCDMRGSTALTDRMKPADFLALLNRYFEASAGSVIAHRGEVLDFIGDAVLAIFPFEDDAHQADAVCRAVRAARDTLRALDEMNAAAAQAGGEVIDLGIGINIGTVMFGNIGVPTRLSFSVIGPTVNEVERIETLTKTIGGRVLVSADVAAQAPDLWHSVGEQRLAGVSVPSELFAPRDECAFAEKQNGLAGQTRPGCHWCL